MNYHPATISTIGLLICLLTGVSSSNPAAAQTVWQQVDSAAGLRYWCLSCADSLVCAGGGRLTSGGSAVRATIDGGESWKTVWVNPQNTFESRYPRSISCAPNGVWYFATDSGRIEKTSNYGGTWEQILLETNRGVAHVSALDEKNLVAAQYPNSILISEDGGESWRSCPLPSSVITLSIRNLQYVDRRTIVANVGNSNRAVLLISTDSGRSFEVRESSRYSVDQFFADSALGWQVGYVPTTGDFSRDLIRYTVDGGRTWAVPLDSAQHWRFGLQAVAFADRTYGIAVGVGGKTMVTEDGGRIWTRRREVPEDEPFRNFVDVECLSPHIAIAVTSFGAVYRLRRTSLRVNEESEPRRNPFTVWIEGTSIHIDMQEGIRLPLTVRWSTLDGRLGGSRVFSEAGSTRLLIELPGELPVSAIIVQVLSVHSLDRGMMIVPAR